MFHLQPYSNPLTVFRVHTMTPLLWSITLGILLLCNGDIRIVKDCDRDTETCTVREVEFDEPSLGQKLLTKQTELYHLNQLSYSDDSAAQSIKVYNPNNEVYDYYWYDPSRDKGILFCPH